ncbi:MAG: hypothetical protein E5V57_20125, partial [Mesorhizobium sp.]
MPGWTRLRIHPFMGVVPISEPWGGSNVSTRANARSQAMATAAGKSPNESRTNSDLEDDIRQLKA